MRRGTALTIPTLNPMSAVSHNRVYVYAVILVCVLLCLVTVRTAWICDDAYISFRTADNAANGYGLRWNVSERVQAFTHPLWLFMLVPGRWMGFDLYAWSLALALLLVIATAILIATQIATSAPAGLLALVALLSSRAFVDFSTSGLENPLQHVLLVLFVCELWRPAGARPALLSTWAGLCLLTRLDAALLVAPALATSVLTSLRGRRLMRDHWPVVALLGGWEVFSVIYFGFPFPNTAYVKLGNTLPRSELVAQGFYYLWNSFRHDPATLTAITAAVLVSLRQQLRPARVIVAGLLLYVGYVIWIGGDFMSGRFLSAPLLLAAVTLARVPMPIREWKMAFASTVMLIVGLAAPAPNLTSGSDFNRRGLDRADGLHIADERLYYWTITGLLAAERSGPSLQHYLSNDVLVAKRQGLKVVTSATIGFFGYEVGPSIHVIDVAGLADPFLARLPHDLPPQRIGHFNHRIPDGYVDVLKGSRGAVILEPSLNQYYRQLALIVSGPLFARNRWRAIWNINLGRLNHLIEDSSYGPVHTTLDQVSASRAEGVPWNAPGNIILRESGVLVHLPDARPIRAVEVSLDANDVYYVVLRWGSKVVWKTTVDAVPDGQGLRIVLLPLEPAVIADRIEIRAGAGDRNAAMGHLRVR